MKQYNMLLIYNDEEKLLEWVQQQTKDCHYSSYDHQRKELTIHYKQCPFSFLITQCIGKWKISKYEPDGYYDTQFKEPQRKYAWRFAGSQFYYVEYLDGMIDAYTIMYLMTRITGRVVEYCETPFKQIQDNWRNNETR